MKIKPNLKNLLLVVVVAMLLSTTGVAEAISFSDEFPSADSIVVASTGLTSPREFGSFWSVSSGHMVSETYTGTGLLSVIQLDLNFNVTKNFLNNGAFVNWDVSVNNTLVGDWSWSANDAIGTVDQSYFFPEIIGSGTYEIAMTVANEVPSGNGSIRIGFGNMTLHGAPAAIPEPSTMLLLGSGLAGLGWYRRRRKRVS